MKKQLIRVAGSRSPGFDAEQTTKNSELKKDMSEHSSTFMAKSTIKAADLEHRRKVNFNIGKYNASVPLGKQQFNDVHLARERAKEY